MCPVYDYECPEGHITESRQGLDVSSIPCPECSAVAKRVAFYRDQSIFGETVAKHYRRAEVPFAERRYGKKLALAQEAGQEMEYATKKVESETNVSIKKPTLWKQAKARAHRIRAGLEAPLNV